MRNLDSIFDGAERTAPNPFREDVYASGITPLPGVTEIHGEAMTRCIRAFESLLSERDSQGGQAWGGSGRTLLVAAPRAGFGKSHLVGRVRAVTESLIAPVALPFDPTRKVAWETMLVSVFNQYRSARCPQAPGCSLFEEVVRFFQSHAVRSAVALGAIDRNEIPEADLALRLQFREVFDPKARTRLVPWLAKRSPEILDAVAPTLGQRWRLEFEDLVFWNRFFQDASRPKTTAFEALKTLESSEARDRLTQFLRIASDCRPVAFIADHLDGFFGSETAGMQIAEILTELRFAVPRSVTLLCLNEDVWESIFEGRIPSAWIDRLTGEATPLREIEPEEAETLLHARLLAAGLEDEAADRWLGSHREACLDGGGEWLSPREVLRKAAAEWELDEAGREVAQGESRPELAPGVSPGGTLPPKEEPTPESSGARPESASIFSAEAGEMESKSATGESDLQRFLRTASDQATRRFPDPGQGAPPEPEAAPPSPPAGEEAESRSPWNQGDDLEERAAAARAAGIDPSSGLTNIDDIIADIRGQGARALSESQPPLPTAPGEEANTPPAPVPPTLFQAAPPESGPVDPAVTREAEEAASAVAGTPASIPAPASGNPFSAPDPEQRLVDLERQLIQEAPGGRMPWHPQRFQKVIGTVGAQFPAVKQREEEVVFRPCLLWQVRGCPVRLGFEAPEHFAYWSEVLDRTMKEPATGKVVLLSHPSSPFDYRSLAAMGADSATAMKCLDVVELTDTDLVRLYAAERFLDEAKRPGSVLSSSGAIRVVAKRLDAFWRRLGRPLGGSAD